MPSPKVGNGKNRLFKEGKIIYAEFKMVLLFRNRTTDTCLMVHALGRWDLYEHQPVTTCFSGCLVIKKLQRKRNQFMVLNV